MSDKLEQIQILFQKRNARKRGPTSSDQFNDMLDEISHDFTEFNSQWNNRLVPLTAALPDGTVQSTIDAWANGLDGGNIYVDQNASAVSNSLYYNSSNSRPNTILEQLDVFYTTMNAIRDDLENQLNTTVVTAAQVAIVDNDGLYAATNVETALAEAMQTIETLTLLSFSSVGEDILPATDNIYSLGSATKRWKDAYIAPSSLHVYALAGEGGGSARDFTLGVDSTDGALLFKEDTTVLTRMLPAGGMQVAELLSAPSNKTGFGTLYTLAGDSNLYFKDSSGNVTNMVTGVSETNTILLSADSDNDEASSYIMLAVDGTNRWKIDDAGDLVAQGTYQILADDTSSDHTAPAYSFTGDPDTGIYLITANEVGVSVGGTQVARFTAAAGGSLNIVESLGVGTVFPSNTDLILASQAGALVSDRIGLYETIANDWPIATFHTSDELFHFGDTFLTVDGNSGHVGIGTGAGVFPGNRLQVLSGATTASIAHFGEVDNEGLYFTTTADTNGRLSMGAELVSSNWTARATSSSAVEFDTGTVKIYADDGLTDGNTFTPTERMMIAASGLVGINVTPEARFHVEEDTALGSTVGDYQIITHVRGNDGSSNKIGLGTWLYRDLNGSNWQTTRVHTAVSVNDLYRTPGVNTKCWYERDIMQNYHVFGHNDTTYLTLHSTGGTFPLDTRLLVGTVMIADGAQSPGVGHGIYSNANDEIIAEYDETNFYYADNAITVAQATGNTTFSAEIYATGSVDAGTGTTTALYINTTSGQLGLNSSSLKVKRDIKDMEDTGWLYKLRPVNFEYTWDQPGTKNYGMIAEEVERVNPSLVYHNKKKDEEISGIHYDRLIPVLINEIQKLRAEIDELKRAN